MKSILTTLFIFFSVICFSQDYLLELESIDDYKALSSIPLSNKYSNVGAVKVIYEIKTDKIYFANSSFYPYHFDFCSSYLNFTRGLSLFNNHNYAESDQREYYLATINHYRDSDIFTFEFSSSDVLSSENIVFFNKVKELIFCHKEIKLFPISYSQQKFITDKHPSTDFITAEYIYKKQNFQVLNPSTSFGSLKYIDIDTFDTKHVNKNDIVVINGTPNEMPLCRGIITSEFQAPLSHIVILSHNRKTPIIALKDVWVNDKLIALNNTLVKFEVGKSYYNLKKVKNIQAELYWKTRDTKTIKKLPIDIDKEGLIDINKLTKNAISYVGGKAANFGELNKIYLDLYQKINTPKGAFAIPFYYYNQHIKENGIDSLISKILDRKLIENSNLLEEKLKEIRKAIKNADINNAFLIDVKERVTENGIERLRFRSSTNAEDIKGFNGAGLYNSKTGVLNNENKSIEKAIKNVWSSLWNLRAFQERAFFKIDQNSVAMGILVHQSFPDEAINGVAITKNIYRPEMNGVVINIQKGETSIVNPPSGITSEELIIKRNINSVSNEDIEIENISYSSLNNNQSLLTYSEIIELNDILSAIKIHFFALQNPISRPLFSDFALDVEFKIEKITRNIIIKQVRLY